MFKCYSIRQGDSHQPCLGPDNRSDRRPSEGADSTRMERVILGALGSSMQRWVDGSAMGRSIDGLRDRCLVYIYIYICIVSCLIMFIRLSCMYQYIRIKRLLTFYYQMILILIITWPLNYDELMHSYSIIVQLA